MVSNLGTFKTLIARDLVVLRKTLVADGIDALILIVLQYVNFVYFFPLMGMSKTLIAPLFVGSIGNVFINTAYDRGISDSADAQFTHFIKYQMTLPLSLPWLFAQKMVTHMINIGVYSIPALTVLLYYAHDTITVGGLMVFALLYFISLAWISAVIMAIAYGTQFFWFIDNVWTRILMPILFLGCGMFPWKAVYALNKGIGFLYALSPLTYSIEGLRSALLGTEAYICFEVCLAVLVPFALVMIYSAYRLFGRRLYA